MSVVVVRDRRCPIIRPVLERVRPRMPIANRLSRCLEVIRPGLPREGDGVTERVSKLGQVTTHPSDDVAVRRNEAVREFERQRARFSETPELLCEHDRIRAFGVVLGAIGRDEIDVREIGIRKVVFEAKRRATDPKTPASLPTVVCPHDAEVEACVARK